MMKPGVLFSIFVLFSQIYCSYGIIGKVSIDISSYDPRNTSTHLFTQFVNSGNHNVEVIVSSNASTISGFYLLQVHSFLSDVSLYENVLQHNLTGRNVGLMQFFRNEFVTSYNIDRSSVDNATIMIALTIYDMSAPIPGGCPQFNSGIKIDSTNPMISISNGPDIISMKSDAPSIDNISCNKSDENFTIEIYHMYLSAQNFDLFEYYSGIKRMLLFEDVKKNGKLVATFNERAKFKDVILFSSYIGVGEVFNILVTKNGKTSAYIPAVSYGEDVNILISQNKDGSNGSLIYVILFSIMPFVALVIIYRGHAFFHFTIFMLGSLCGTVVSFFLLNEGESSINETFLISVMLGILYGLVWVSIWYKCGLPLLSATLTFIHTGALIASMIYHVGLADNENFHKNGLYWSVFGGILFMCWFFLSVFAMWGHIFSCSFLGTYILMMTTLNSWMGGSLQYIIVNVYRRLTVPNFDKVILDPPFQPRDKFIVLCGILFVLHGYKKQLSHQKDKPPFPPHNTRRFIDERSPLLM